MPIPYFICLRIELFKNDEIKRFLNKYIGKYTMLALVTIELQYIIVNIDTQHKVLDNSELALHFYLLYFYDLWYFS